MQSIRVSFFLLYLKKGKTFQHAIFIYVCFFLDKILHEILILRRIETRNAFNEIDFIQVLRSIPIDA